MPLIPSYFEVCERAARAGGQVLLDWQDRFSAREKAPKDLVTEADLASQQTIRDLVLGAFPDHGFLGEEQLPAGGQHPGGAPASEYRWLVDPLDGTANYVHQLPLYSVSVALERKGEVLVGVVFDPVRQECFAARAGGGAFLNGEPLRVSGCLRLVEALVASSFSANVQRESREVAGFVDTVESCLSVRRLGSAALNLCYVAAGRLDAYWATNVKAWDVAAGILLVREAGGRITSVDGSPFQLDRPRLAAAATGRLHAELLDILARSYGPDQDSS